MDETMDKVFCMFHKVLEMYAKRGCFKDDVDVQTAKAAVSGIVKIKTLEAMEKYGENAFRGRAFESRSFNMEEEESDKEDIREKVAQMMNEAETEHEKSVYREILNKMH